MPAPSVIVLVIDRLGAGWLGPYGNTWLETPNFNRLAAQGSVVETAIADSPDLVNAYRGFWLGAHELEPDRAEAVSLPTLLKPHHDSSLLVTDEPQLAGHRVASDFSRVQLLTADDATDAASEIEQTGLYRFFHAASAIVSEPHRPHFVWLHSRGLSAAWDGPLALRYQFADEDDPEPPDLVVPPERILPEDFDPDELLGIMQAYAGQVALADLCLGMLLDAIDDSPRGQDTLLVVTSPRGYPLGEHRRVGPCDHALYGELLHVPLLVRFPGQTCPARLQSIVQPRELYRLIGEICQVHHHDAALAASLALRELTTGEAGPATAACSFAAGQRAIRTSAWFLHQQQSSEEPQSALYAKPDDRWEANEIASRCKDVVGLLANELDRFEAAAKRGTLAELPPLAELLSDRWR